MDLDAELNLGAAHQQVVLVVFTGPPGPLVGDARLESAAIEQDGIVAGADFYGVGGYRLAVEPRVESSRAERFDLDRPLYSVDVNLDFHVL